MMKKIVFVDVDGMFVMDDGFVLVFVKIVIIKVRNNGY